MRWNRKNKKMTCKLFDWTDRSMKKIEFTRGKTAKDLLDLYKSGGSRTFKHKHEFNNCGISNMGVKEDGKIHIIPLHTRLEEGKEYYVIPDCIGGADAGEADVDEYGLGEIKDEHKDEARKIIKREKMRTELKFYGKWSVIVILCVFILSLIAGMWIWGFAVKDGTEENVTIYEGIDDDVNGTISNISDVRKVNTSLNLINIKYLNEEHGHDEDIKLQKEQCKYILDNHERWNIVYNQILEEIKILEEAINNTDVENITPENHTILNASKTRLSKLKAGNTNMTSMEIHKLSDMYDDTDIHSSEWTWITFGMGGVLGVVLSIAGTVAVLFGIDCIERNTWEERLNIEAELEKLKMSDNITLDDAVKHMGQRLEKDMKSFTPEALEFAVYGGTSYGLRDFIERHPELRGRILLGGTRLNMVRYYEYDVVNIKEKLGLDMKFLGAQNAFDEILDTIKTMLITNKKYLVIGYSQDGIYRGNIYGRENLKDLSIDFGKHGGPVEYRVFELVDPDQLEFKEIKFKTKKQGGS